VKNWAFTWVSDEAIKVAGDALVGKTVVTPAVVSYTVPGTEGDNEVQDEVTAYVMGTIMPANTESASSTEVSVKKVNHSFLPSSLIEWLALFAIILILMILGRSIYVSWKGDKTTH
jgi:hypothetical protein